MRVIGIDPGKSGAIVALDDGKVVARHLMPVVTAGKEKLLDIRGLDVILYDLVCTPDIDSYAIVVEDVHAIFGSAAGSTFDFGFTVGVIQGLLVGNELSYAMVQPKVWQKVSHMGIPEIRKPSTVVKTGKHVGLTRQGPRDCKAMSLLAAKRLFPTVDLKASPRCSKPHDGIVDALLIAYYGHLVLKGGNPI